VNPYDRKDVRKSTERQKVEAREVDEFLKQMLSLPQGRRYFWNLLGSCGIGHNPFRTDPVSMAFTCGEMNVGQRILADIVRVAPERYVEMMGEQNDRRNLDTGSDGANTDSGAGTGQPDLFQPDSA
jgi:hypothetical protein